MGYTIADCILIPLILTGLFFAGRWTIRFLVRSFRADVIDPYRVYRRGVLDPIQVRQEFIDTVGREPTIEEVHDLHDLIKSEHAQARNHLLLVGSAALATGYAWHRAVHRERIF